MHYTAQIYDPVKGIDKILISASKFNIDRFLYALTYKNWDEEKIEFMGNEVAIYRKKLEIEYNRLVDFSKVFNKEFATMNNKCYNSALIMLNKLRSGISETKRIFMKFCPRACRERIIQTVSNYPASAYDYAYISANSYQLPLFKFEEYPACVSGLYNEMEKFFFVLIRCIQLCKQVLNEEKIIRSDNRYCIYLFEEFKKKVFFEVVDIIMMIPPNSEYLSEERNPAIASRNKYANDDAWAPVGFHNYSRSEVKHLIIKQMLENEDGNDLTKMERLLFGDDEQKVHKYRHIIKHFDELIPESYNRKHLPARYIQMFFHYVGIPFKMENYAVQYFNELYLSSSTHKFFTVSYQAVNGYKKKVLEDKDGSYTVFVSNIKKLFPPVFSVQKTAIS